MLLGLMEALLRLTGYGHSYPLFIEAKSPVGFLQPNPELIKRYFSNPDSAPSISPDTIFFRSVKPQDTYRIVVQGGSSAAGFPYGRFGSLSGMLQQRFKRQYPNQNIEVINTAMSAVNSYTMLDLVDEIIAIQPDLILIYAGHNEFLGVMGVGSTFAARGGRNATLMFLKFKELRLYQLMQQIIQLFIIKPDSSTITDRTLMAEVAAGQKILYNSDLYEQGLVQFSENLDLIIGKYRAHNIPVVLGTLASNEKDQKPFATTEGEFGANSIFNKAESLYDSANYSAAKRQYQLARDRDLLRFRAPSAFNNIIQAKASEAVFISDSEAMIRNDARHGIIGFEHMLEHLHPNVRGYFLLAESFAETIRTMQLLGTAAETISIEQAWQDVPLTQVDVIVGDKKIEQLTSDYPFSEHQRPVKDIDKKTYEYRLAAARLAGTDWLTTMNDMLQTYQQQNRISDAAIVAAMMFDAIPDQHQIAYIAGQLYFQSNDVSMALYYHKKALDIAPNNVNYLLMTARSYYSNQQLASSVKLLEKATRLAPGNHQANMQLQRIRAELDRE